MSRAAALAMLGLGVGLLAGFIWGGRTRDALPGATQTSFKQGVLTMRVDAGQALTNGLASFLG
jgi:hypothetical protein